MGRFVWGIIRHRKFVVAAFLAVALLCACCIPFVKTNYNMVSYLPESAQSTTAVSIMEDEFTQPMPNANVMVRDVGIADALEVKQALEEIDGVESVMWLDDVTDVTVPIETQDESLVETYYHPLGATGTALYQVSVADGKEGVAVPEIRSLIDRIARDKALPSTDGAASFEVGPALVQDEGAGAGNAVSGEAADTAQMQASTVEEVLGAVAIIVPVILFLLVVSTMSWIEPLLFVAAIGVSILMNMGTNIFLGEVSFITYSVSPILQLAVSLDYAIFLLHAFGRERLREGDPEKAMARAMKQSVTTILASAVTTLFGFAALAFMQFGIGADLGLNLVKGIMFSLVTVVVFLPALTLGLYKWIDKTAHRRFMPSFKGVDKALSKVRVPALVLVALLVVPAFLGQAHNTFTYQNNSPEPDMRYGQDVLAIQNEFGQQNAVVVLVPKGDVAKEAELSDDLASLPNVKGVMSYAHTVGTQVPVEYLSEEAAGQFYSDGWARIVAYVDTDTESEEAFATVQAVQDAAASHYETFYAAGQSANLYDMSKIVAVDNVRVSLIAVVAIFVVLLLTFRSLMLPIVLLLTIEAGIWINLSIPYFMGDDMNFIGYLVINTVQLGATIDYGILLTTHYLRHRRSHLPREAVRITLGETFPSLLVSAGILATAGFALGVTSSLSAVQVLGMLLGRGALISLAMVTCFLPGLLIYLDRIIRKTTSNADFFEPDECKLPLGGTHERRHESH